MAQTIWQASVSFGTNSKLDLFAQAVNDQLLEQWTPEHEIHVVLNTSTTDLFLGTGEQSGALDASSGFPLAPGTSIRFDLSARTRIFGTFGQTLGGSARILIIFK